MFEALLPSLISAGANIFGGMTSAAGASASNAANIQMQQQTNAMNMQMFHENQAYQERMANTAYQRQMADMKEAGLNPILAYQKGGGAPVPTASPPNLEAPRAENTQLEMGRAIGAAANSAVTTYKDTEAAKLANQQTKVAGATEDLQRMQTAATKEETFKKNAEIEKVKQETAILKHNTSAAEADAQFAKRRAIDAEHYGTSPGIVGQTGASAEHIARRVLEMMNNYQ